MDDGIDGLNKNNYMYISWYFQTRFVLSASVNNYKAKIKLVSQLQLSYFPHLFCCWIICSTQRLSRLQSEETVMMLGDLFFEWNPRNWLFWLNPSTVFDVAILNCFICTTPIIFIAHLLFIVKERRMCIIRVSIHILYV